MKTVGAVAGGALVVAMVISVAQILVIPRGRIGLLRAADRVVDSFYSFVGVHLGGYDRRDAWRSSEPAALLATLILAWLVGFLFGYALLLWPFEATFGAALRESGSSIFTLGFASRPGTSPTAIDLVAAATGMILVALQIAYLPALYSAYNRRETEITLLGVRAGEPAWGPELLARSRFGVLRDDLSAFYLAWERWAADVAESHSSYPALMRFRSPDPASSWLVGLLAVLDSAALYLAASPDTAPIQARLCLRMGSRCVHQLARSVRIPVEEDPRPDAPVQLTLEEFRVGWARLLAADFPVERSIEEAWTHFRGWRVNYESAAYNLAYGIDAVPALWSGRRRVADPQIAPVKPANRTPANPAGDR
jgi:hypothetical protein